MNSINLSIQFNIWKTFSEMNTSKLSDAPVQFNNLRIKNNVEIHKTSNKLNSVKCYIIKTNINSVL